MTEHDSSDRASQYQSSSGSSGDINPVVVDRTTRLIHAQINKARRPDLSGNPYVAAARRRRRNRRLSVAGLVGALAIAAGFLVVPGLSSDSCEPESGLVVGKGDGVLKLGSLTPMSGDLAAEGPQLRAATAMAERDVAAAGGVPGIQVVPSSPGSELDEGAVGSGDACESAAVLLASGVDAIIGPSASGNSLNIVDRVTQAGGLLVSPASTSPELSNPDVGRFYRTAASDVLQGRILGDLVAAEGNSRVAVLARDDAYGLGLQAQIIGEMRGRGVTDVRALTYSADSPDFGAVVEQLKSYNPDGVVIVGFDETRDLLRQLPAAGLGPGSRNVYGTDGFLRATLPAQVFPGRPEALAGLRGTSPGSSPAFRASIDVFRPGLQDTTYAAQAYDAVVVTALAAAAAGSDDPRVFQSELNDVTREGTKCVDYAGCVALLKNDRNADIDYDGASGQLDFTGTGEPCVATYRIVRFGQDGKPYEYRTGNGTNLCTSLS